MNPSIIKPSSANVTLRLPVMEAFYTIQGEGHHTGKAAYFIRLGGCDVGCVWCDVKDSWDATAHPMVDVESIVNTAAEFPSQIAVITGGEPCMYDLGLLTASLREKGFKTHLETSGAYPVQGDFDWVCVSPKKFKSPLEEVLKLADELKVVIFHPSDFEWAESNAKGVGKECKLLLQPEFDKSSKMMSSLVDYVKAHPQWSISLQTHKIIGIP